MINNWQLKKTGLSHQVWSHKGSTFKKKMTLNSHFSRPAQTDPYIFYCFEWESWQWCWSYDWLSTWLSQRLIARLNAMRLGSTVTRWISNVITIVVYRGLSSSIPFIYTFFPPVGITGPDLGQWKDGEDNITKYFIWYFFRGTHLLFYPTGENGCLHAGAQGYPCDQYCQQVFIHPQSFNCFVVKKS